MLAVPADTPVTIPVEDPAVATAVLPLLHAPPGVTSLNAVVAPIQTLVAPVIPEGSGLTVTVTMDAQPVTSE